MRGVALAYGVVSMEGRGVWGLAWRGQLGSLTRHRFVLCYDALISPRFWQNFLRGALRRPMLGLYKTELFCSIFHSGDYPDLSFVRFRNREYLSFFLKD